MMINMIVLLLLIIIMMIMIIVVIIKHILIKVPGKEHFKGRGWCPPKPKEYDGFKPDSEIIV